MGNILEGAGGPDNSRVPVAQTVFNTVRKDKTEKKAISFCPLRAYSYLCTQFGEKRNN